MKRTRTIIAAAAAVATAGFAHAATGLEVTAQRLTNAQGESQNWLLPYGSYSAHNHSSLSQINRSNVSNLAVKFLHSIGGMNTANATANPPTLQSTPVVDDGMMYVHNGWGQVFKIDVRAGNRAQTVWIHDPKLAAGQTMRGSVALLGNYLYHNTGSGVPRLIKVDTNTGEMVWEVSIAAPADKSAGSAPSVQPLAVRDKLLIANRGTRGSIAANAASDGRELWRFWTVPGPGEVGHETWAGDWAAWKTGGAPVWMQASYDPETNLAYYGTAEAKPWGDPEFRPGDNLFSDSVVALDVDTGKMKWFFQVVPNDTHDRDNVNPRMLYDVTIGGQQRKVVAQFTRGGFYYTWDRANGAFINAEPYTTVTWTRGIDPKTGKPLEYNPAALVQNYGPGKSVMAGKPETSQNVCPNWIGSPTLMPPTFDARRQMAFSAAATGCFNTAQPQAAARTDVAEGANRNFPGVVLTSLGRQQGRIVSVDVRTGKQVAESLHPWPLYSGALGTAGDLIFTAQADGKVMAIDKDTLKELWSFHVGTPIAAPPITYEANGKQYVAIAVGAALYRPDDFNTQELLILQRNSQLVVFGL